MLYMVKFPLREKYMYLEFFWSVIFWILHIQSESGKIYTRKIPNTDTFHAVCIIKKCLNDVHAEVIETRVYVD